MDLNKKQDKTKLDIKKELIVDDLSKILSLLIVFLLVAGLCGYAGYVYSKDNNLSIAHGIIFGIIFPLGVGLLEACNLKGFLSFILYTIIYLSIMSSIPTFVGVIILFLLIGIYIFCIIYIVKKDRTSEIEKKYILNKYTHTKDITSTQNNTYKSSYDIEKEILIDNINDTDDAENDYLTEEDEYECEMCFKKITREEYELYDCMCEECFMDAHTDKNGNFHDDENFDL